jgi:hypothetical protein
MASMQHVTNAEHAYETWRPWVRFASPFASRVKPCLSGEMRTRLQELAQDLTKMDT